jgi:hypothetical protein
MSSDVELNEIGVLKRREIEARLLAPIVDALGDKFGRQAVLEVVRSVVSEIARRQEGNHRVQEKYCGEAYGSEFLSSN